MIHELAAAVRSGRRSAVEVTENALDRAEQSQPALNAFSSIDRERAMDTAAAVDREVAAGEDPGPLAGVPVAIKDMFDHAGRPNTLGSSAAPVIPETTAPAVRRLESAGAVVIGRTVLHEFAFGFSSENHWFGPVHNPWDLTLSPGGSSGGSAAAVAAGLVPAALGTDTGGSVRVPAALCGIVGLKVTHGRVPLSGVYPLAPFLDTVGPLARSVADCAAIYTAIAGDDATDPLSVPMQVDLPAGPRPVSEMRIGIPHPMVDRPVVADQQQAVDALVAGLRRRGAQIVDVDIEEFAPTEHTVNGIFFEAASVHRERFTADPSGYGPEVRKRVAAALDVTGEQYLAALEWRRGAQAAVLRAMDGLDALLTPTVATLRKTIGEPLVALGDEDVHYIAGKSVFATPVNHIGLPALALPLPGPSIPPAGVQLIGLPWSESDLLEIGLGLEQDGLIETQKPPNWRPGGNDAIPGRSA